MARLKAEPDRLRGTGRTTKLIQKAPRGAFFICVRGDSLRSLARNLDREDLKFIDGLHWDYWQHCAGQYNHKIIVDHCLALSPQEADMIAMHNSRVPKGWYE